MIRTTTRNQAENRDPAQCDAAILVAATMRWVELAYRLVEVTGDAVRAASNAYGKVDDRRRTSLIGRKLA